MENINSVSLGDAISRFFAGHGIAFPATVLAACSGGVDSTALLLALHETPGIALLCAHVNHHLRGDDSDADEAFVRDLTQRLGVPLHVADGTLDDGAVRHRGIEAAAREVRHARLQEIRRAAGAQFIATAHQKNDQAETVLMRLMTGSGPAGLRGIHPVRDDGVIRPLLEVSRAEIEAFLRERSVTPRHDRSNDDPRFLRNRVRAMLREFDPSTIDNLAAAAATARDQWRILERAIDAAENVVATERDTLFVSLPADRWLRQALLHRHIVRLAPAEAREVSSDDLERLASEVETAKRISVTKSLELIRRGSELLLRLRPVPAVEFEYAVDGRVRIDEIGATLHVRPAQAADRQRFVLPEDAAPAFTVRNRRPGDRFQPLGMQHDKKLKDFLIDRKIPHEIRDRIPLLIWNGDIVWVAGIEVSERYKVTDAPGKLFEVWLEEGQEGVQR